MRQKEHWKIVTSIQKTVAGFYAVFYASVTTQELYAICYMLLVNKTVERMLLVAEILVLLICHLSEFTGEGKDLEVKTTTNIS